MGDDPPVLMKPNFHIADKMGLDIGIVVMMGDNTVMVGVTSYFRGKQDLSTDMEENTVGMVMVGVIAVFQSDVGTNYQIL